MKKICLFAILILCCCGYTQIGAKHTPQPPAHVKEKVPRIIAPFADDPRCRQWVDSVMERMSLKEQIGQLFIYTIAPERTKANRELLRKVIRDYKIGGLLFSGGQLHNQVMLTNEAQAMAEVPLMITFDGEWGLAMRLKDTPRFPKNMVLGCIRNDSLLYEYGREVARQCREIGVQVNFAPVADVNINPENPVINVRSFGEDPRNVARKVQAYARGLEDGGILSVCKHFPGHGDTQVDSHKALPRLDFSRERLDSVELYPFKQAIRAGLGGMMVGHLEVPELEPKSGIPSSLSRRMVFGLLRHELQFKGLIFTDALAMKGVSVKESICLRALKAGNDLLLVPRRIKEEVEAVTQALKHGELSREDIQEKCRKVLMYKYALGLSRKPHIQLSGIEHRINTPHTAELIDRLNTAAVVVAGNREEILPFDTHLQEIAVLHVGNPQDTRPMLKQLAQYTRPVEFCLSESDLTDRTLQQLRDTLNTFRRVVVCVTKRKPACFEPFFTRFRPSVPTVYLSYITGKETARLYQKKHNNEALILAHSTNEKVQQYVANLIYGKEEAYGLLSTRIGDAYACGEGVSIKQPGTQQPCIPEDYGMDSRLLTRIDTIAEEGIRTRAYQDCQIVVWKEGKEIYNKAFGTHTTRHIYDLASLTKTTATLLAVMKLYDEGKLNLSDEIGKFLPFVRGTDKEHISIRRLLMHESGLPSTIFFYRQAIDEDSYTGSLFKAKRDKSHQVQIGRKTWANGNYRFKEGIISPIATPEHGIQICDSMWIRNDFKETYLQQIADATLRTPSYRYSCVGFIVLQQVVETITGMSMDEYLHRTFYQPMGLERTGFKPLQFARKEECLPTGIDRFLRHTTLQGFVHDESAAFQGGVSGNAGLFSNGHEVALIHQMLLNGGELNGKRYLSKTTCDIFTTTTSKISRRGLGFDKPDMKNIDRSPCCEQASADVYGHTGFTGTCAWVDPKHQLIFVFLSNRTYPDAWNGELMKQNIRPRIQEVLYQAIIGQ